MTKTRGALIVFEGCDRAGKSTQSRKLVEKLNQLNYKTSHFTFPDRTTKIGQIINEYLTKKSELNDEVIHLLFSANRWEHVPNIVSHLNNGHTCIIDRYSYSGIAYSAAKKDMSFNWCLQPEIGLPQPDAVFFLTLDYEESLKRANFGNERYEELDFQKKVFNIYNKIKESFVVNSETSWLEINSNGNIEQIHENILKDALQIIENVKNNPILRLHQ